MVKERLGWNRMKTTATEYSYIASNICFDSMTAGEGLTNEENAVSL